MLELLIKSGIEETKAKEILQAMKEAKLYTTSLENIDERYDKLKRQKEGLDEEIKTANKTIEGLKEANKDNETLQATIKTHEATIETMKVENEAKFNKMTVDNAIANKLSNVKDPKYKKLLETQFDKEKLVVKDDQVIGLEDQFNILAETYKEWFIDPAAGAGTGFNPSGLPNGTKNPFSKEHFNLTEQARLLRENPTVAAQMKAAAIK